MSKSPLIINSMLSSTAKTAMHRLNWQTLLMFLILPVLQERNRDSMPALLRGKVVCKGMWRQWGSGIKAPPLLLIYSALFYINPLPPSSKSHTCSLIPWLNKTVLVPSRLYEFSIAPERYSNLTPS